MSRLEAYDYWKRCAYISIRRLQDSDDKDVFSMNIDHFLDQVIGKPYLFKVSDIFVSKYSRSLSASTLTSTSSSSASILPNLFSRNTKNVKIESNNSNNDRNSDSNNNRISENDANKIIDIDEISSTYFCSQLVADCLKQLDIIDDSLNSKSFWPGNFCQDDLIDKITINGYSYGEETIINFTTLEIGSAKVMNNANIKSYYNQEEKPKRITHEKIESSFNIKM